MNIKTKEKTVFVYNYKNPPSFLIAEAVDDV
jgi:hypothetical protein